MMTQIVNSTVLNTVCVGFSLLRGVKDGCKAAGWTLVTGTISVLKCALTTLMLPVELPGR